MSELEVQPLVGDDSFLSSGSFLPARDRRRSPRIPLAKPVRVGPPGGLPQSPVSATDLSVGGLFIDADRPVRVGARFCVQVPLANGTSVYVEEAEVVYNRQTTHAPGFGVRFLRVNPSTEMALAQEVERMNPGALSSASPEDMATVVPAAFGGDLTATPSLWPEDVSDIGPSDAAMRPAVVSAWSMQMGDWFWRHARRLGLLLGGVAAVTVLAATVVFLANTPIEPPPGEAGPFGAVAPDTHRALMQAETPAAEVVPPPPVELPTTAEKVNPLPGLVDVETPERDAIQRLNRGDEDTDGADQFVFALSRATRVKRSMIYRSPERFVIDIAGRDPKIDTKPEASGGIRRFRVGRHKGFTRLVLDAEQAIASASAELVGRELSVSITYK